MEDLIRHDGERVEAVGRYRCVARPIRGVVTKPGPADHAAIDLDDGTRVFLEPLDSDRATRPAAERARFDGKTVRVHGIARKRMPARGEGPLAPCLSDITEISEEREP